LAVNLNQHGIVDIATEGPVYCPDVHFQTIGR
jgi:hypothetical protein